MAVLRWVGGCRAASDCRRRGFLLVWRLLLQPLVLPLQQLLLLLLLLLAVQGSLLTLERSVAATAMSLDGCGACWELLLVWIWCWSLTNNKPWRCGDGLPLATACHSGVMTLTLSGCEWRLHGPCPMPAAVRLLVVMWCS